MPIMKQLLFILWISLPIIIDAQKYFSSIPCSSGYRSGRIVGGTDTAKGEIPFIVSLTRRGGHFCGATIINEKWLITAAHCMCNGLNKIFKPSYIRGVVGLHKISQFKNDKPNLSLLHSPQEVNFEKIVVHPNYKCTHPNDDLALLKMGTPLTFTDYIKPLCIASNENDSYEDTLATVSGWGWTEENQEIGLRPDVLQKATIKVWSNEKCQKSFIANGKKTSISSTQMCAGFENGGSDSCWADSGGPLVSGVKGDLIGVVSTGVGCSRPGLPGIYTRLTKYSKWIHSIIY